ncbi:MAG: GTPase [Planctomycetota bacterium]
MTAGGRVRRLGARGPAAIQILRLEGEAVRSFLERHFRARGTGRGAVRFGDLVADGERIDEVLLRIESEEAVEIHHHGGAAVSARIRAICETAGLPEDSAEGWDPALFPDARTDAVQREALAGLSAAWAEEAALFFLAASEGALRLELEALIALLREAEHRNVGAESRLATVLGRSAFGLAMSSPPRVVLAGSVNAGKSTLFNAICGRERVIADAAPGTTRDAVEARVVLAGYPFRLVDTAGVREARDPVERLGVARALRERASADLVLEVGRADEAVRRGEIPTEPAAGGGRIPVLTHVDLLSEDERVRLAELAPAAVAVSGRTGRIEALAARLVYHSAFRGPAVRGWAIPFTERQVREIERAASLMPSDPREASRVLEMIVTGAILPG